MQMSNEDNKKVIELKRELGEMKYRLDSANSRYGREFIQAEINRIKSEIEYIKDYYTQR